MARSLVEAKDAVGLSPPQSGRARQRVRAKHQLGSAGKSPGRRPEASSPRRRRRALSRSSTARAPIEVLQQLSALLSASDRGPSSVEAWQGGRRGLSLSFCDVVGCPRSRATGRSCCNHSHSLSDTTPDEQPKESVRRLTSVSVALPTVGSAGEFNSRPSAEVSGRGRPATSSAAPGRVSLDDRRIVVLIPPPPRVDSSTFPATSTGDNPLFLVVVRPERPPLPTPDQR